MQESPGSPEPPDSKIQTRRPSKVAKRGFFDIALMGGAIAFFVTGGIELYFLRSSLDDIFRGRDSELQTSAAMLLAAPPLLVMMATIGLIREVPRFLRRHH